MKLEDVKCLNKYRCNTNKYWCEICRRHTKNELHSDFFTRKGKRISKNEDE